MADNISSASGCTRHPSLHQLPGICPSCLRERLHQLVASPENTTYPSQRLHLKSPSFSSSSYEYDSLPGVGPWSPPMGSRRRGQGSNRRDCSVAAKGGSRSLLVAVRVGGSLRKSRSIGLVGGRWDGDEEEEEEMVKRGFWSKLIRFRSGRRSREKERWSHHPSHHHDLRGTLGDTSMY